MAITHRALLACRSPPRLSRWRTVLPEEASTGAEPHRIAKAAPERSRPGLSPVATSSAPATWVRRHAGPRAGGSPGRELDELAVEPVELGAERLVAAGELAQGEP